MTRVLWVVATLAWALGTLGAFGAGLGHAAGTSGQASVASQGREAEDSMFGGDAPAAEATPVAAATPASTHRPAKKALPPLGGAAAAGSSAAAEGGSAKDGGSSTDGGAATDDSLTPRSSSAQDAFASGATKEDPLAIGGTYYQQAVSTFDRGLTEGQQSLAMPLQFDAYLDSRPSDRVRGYVAARLLYDSSKDVYGKPTAGRTFSLGSYSAVSGPALPNNPQVVLDQAWLKFDIQRTAFLSVGKQHVKWGTGRIWNPSDALNPQRRDPLQPYDLRLGSNMLTVQVPWEAKQANLYAIALLDNPQPASTLQQLGGALRVEGLLGPAEVGVSAVGRGGENPRFGADVSTPLGPFDAYAEAALLTGDHWSNDQFLGIPKGLSYPASLSDLYAVNRLPGSVVQAVAGLNYTWAWRENRTATFGGEYFYNELGIDDGGMIPVLVYQGRYTPFYVAKHYAALYLSAEGPDSGNKTSYNLSTLANLVDKSAVSRLDFNWLLLDYLSFGAHASINYGGQGGEFNFSLHTPALSDGYSSIAPVDIPGSSGEAGVSLRVSF